MKSFAKALAVSLCAHIVVVGGLLFARDHENRPIRPVVIDFMLGNLAPGNNVSSQAPGDNAAFAQTAASRTKNRQGSAPDTIKLRLSPKKAICRKKSTAETIGSPKKNAANSWPGSSKDVLGTDVLGIAKGTGNNPTGAASAGAGPVVSPEERYMREHFAYIRDLVRKKLKYPRAAVSMGLFGKVGVSFTVLENGELADIEVSRSSGARILDMDAVDTVMRAAPFPPPPVKARIVIPVEYILE
ncbi:energy transducer TonB [Desulforegula conservatrix]|uniref:energy transducer TonB n=1 Tax=Desulforegula conservatrix TaxID=153026 RepID=UPI00042848AC|nr:energy transducer TonB [Desulforegula conservatrix]